MRIGLTILFVLTAPIVMFAGTQPPDSLWGRTFGGSSSDYCYSVQQTTDGGYILGGETYSYGSGDWDFWLVKTDSNGDSLWSRTFGGGNDEACYAVRQTIDGGYILAGYTSSYGAGGFDFWLVKTDSSGDSLWSHTFGGDKDDICYSVQQTTDSGYVLGGYNNSVDVLGYSDFWLVKTDTGGVAEWSHTFGGSNYDVCHSVQQISGGYILGGYTSSAGAGLYDFWLVRTDANGDSLLWSRTFGGGSSDYCRSLQQTSDGGYILGGYTYSYGAGNNDFWLVKTDTGGIEEWSSTFGGSSYERCYSVQQTLDGGYILGGGTYSYGAGSYDCWLVRADANGDSLWSRTFGGSSVDRCHSVQQTLGGGYILGGYTSSYGAGSSDFWLVKTGLERPYHTTVYLDSVTGNPVIRWIAPYGCDYLIYSTTNSNHDGSPPGPDWKLEVTLPSIPAGSAEWEDTDGLDESYMNYVVVTSCP